MFFVNSYTVGLKPRQVTKKKRHEKKKMSGLIIALCAQEKSLDYDCTENTACNSDIHWSLSGLLGHISSDRTQRQPVRQITMEAISY
jgi:hypothetical protein